MICTTLMDSAAEPWGKHRANRQLTGNSDIVSLCDDAFASLLRGALPARRVHFAGRSDGEVVRRYGYTYRLHG